MSRHFACVGAVALLACGVCGAQSSKPGEGWLTENYRLDTPPPPRPAMDPVLEQLQEVQNTTLSILRKANFAGDYEAALAAAQQAMANAQLMAALRERPQPPKTGKAPASEAKPQPARYLIALKDSTVEAVTAYWWDGRMLHYTTRDGAHEQVRRDFLDRELTAELNRGQGMVLP